MSGATAAVVQRIEVLPVSPAVRPALIVSGARGTHARSNFLLIRVTTSAGVVGLGEVSATLIWSGENASTAQVVIREALAGVLIGQPLAPVAALEAAMDRALAGHPFTKAGLSMALWDAWSRTLDVPLAVCLGGPHRTVVPTKCSLSGDGDRLAATLHAAREAGFTRFKLKVGMGVESDLDRIAQARTLVGPGTFLGLDANGGYTPSAARRVLAQAQQWEVAFLEQPTPPGDLAALADLRHRGLPIVADESVFGVDSLVAVLRAGAADVVSVYVGKSGGPGRAVEMATIADAFGIDVLIGSNGELGVGAAAQLQVACAVRRLSHDIPSDIIGGHYYEQDVLASPLDLSGSNGTLPDAPGLGVTLRPDLLDAFTAIEG